ncbi:MAG TPA: hypothetical protein VKB51_04245 [bacterium]|nr:hypothetical protein [bacterium]
MKLPTPHPDSTPPQPLHTDVILLDIIKYTLLPNQKQYQALFYLNRIIGTITSLLDMGEVLHKKESVIRRAIPNGDGCYFVLNPRVAGYGPLLALFLRNFLLFNNRFLDHLFNGVRVSVHHGPIIPVEFLGVENFVGDGLNVCARLLVPGVQTRAKHFYAGEGNYVIASAQAWEAFHELFPPEREDVQAYLRKIQFTHSREFAVKDKHKQVLEHRARFIDCAKLIGSAPPRPKALLAS